MVFFSKKENCEMEGYLGDSNIKQVEMSSVMLKITSDARVRGMQVPTGEERYAVYDFLTIACEKADNGAYARKTFSNIIKKGSEFRQEVVRDVLNLQFPGAGQRETPTMTIRGLSRLLMILGGKVSAEFRELAEGVFTRVMAGDRSLIEVINSNAASGAPIHQAFRAALAQEPVAPILDDLCLKRKQEREDAQFDLEFKERTSQIRDRELARIKDFTHLMSSLNPDWKSDTRLRLQVEDSLKNVVLNKGPKMVTNGDEPPSVSISQIAHEKGISLKKGDMVAIGRAVAQGYFVKYGKKPSKHRQWVDGAEREVNSYTEKDRDLIEEAIKEQFVESDAESDW